MTSTKTRFWSSRSPVWPACAALFGLVSCQKVGSDSIKTSGIYADLSVYSTGDGNSHVRAALRVGGSLSNTYLDLQTGDSLTADLGGMMTQTLTRTPELFGAVSYTGTYTGDAPGTTFDIAFTRTSDVSAPSSSATLPAKFTIMAPTANAVSSRAQPLTISWDVAGTAAGDLIDISLVGLCVQTLTKGGQTDNGQVTIMANELKASSTSQPATCDVSVTVVRKHLGTLDKAYGSGGTFYGSQQRGVTISSTP